MFQVIVRKEPKKPAKGAKGKGKGKEKAIENAPTGTQDDEKAKKQAPKDKGKAKASTSAQAKVQQVTIKEEASEVILSPQLKRKRLLEELADGDNLEDQEPDDNQAPLIPELADPPASEVTDPIAAQEASLGGEPVEYRKHVDEDMRELCMTLKCRRAVTMKAFDSPPPFRGAYC